MAGCDNTLASIWPDDLYFVVPESDGPYISDGGQIITLPDRFDGWKLRVFRNNGLLDFNEQISGNPYWEEIEDTNSINLSNDALKDETFAIFAYKPKV